VNRDGARHTLLLRTRKPNLPLQGDDLAAAGHGLSTGFVRPPAAGRQGTASLGLSPGGVDSIEAHMLSLLGGVLAEGAAGQDGGASAGSWGPMDAMERSLERSRLEVCAL
jgi:hypothetical protein